MNLSAKTPWTPCSEQDTKLDIATGSCAKEIADENKLKKKKKKKKAKSKKKK